MARVKGAMMTRKRRNKVLKAAKGYWGAKSKHFKMAKQAVMKSGNYASSDVSRKREISAHCGSLVFPPLANRTTSIIPASFAAAKKPALP